MSKNISIFGSKKFQFLRNAMEIPTVISCGNFVKLKSKQNIIAIKLVFININPSMEICFRFLADKILSTTDRRSGDRGTMSAGHQV